jgi:hypothetical protein
MCPSEFFSRHLPIAAGSPDLTKKRIFAAAELVFCRVSFQGATRTCVVSKTFTVGASSRCRIAARTRKTGANIEAAQLKIFDTARLYRPFAKAGRQMAAGLNERRPLRALPAQIISKREII